MGYEYVRDYAALVHEVEMLNVLVLNGVIEETPWRQLLPLIDAMSIDLKGFTEGWYKCLGGDLETIKRSILLATEQRHLEVTTMNESEEKMRALWAARTFRCTFPAFSRGIRCRIVRPRQWIPSTTCARWSGNSCTMSTSATAETTYRQTKSNRRFPCRKPRFCVFLFYLIRLGGNSPNS